MISACFLPLHSLPRTEILTEHADQGTAFIESVDISISISKTEMVCLLSLKDGYITHLARLRKKRRWATAQRLVQIDRIRRIAPVLCTDIINSIHDSTKKHAAKTLHEGGYFPKKTLSNIFLYLSKNVDSFSEIISFIIGQNKIFPQRLTPYEKEILATESEAVSISLYTIGINKSQYNSLLQFDNNTPRSIIDGLQEFRAREDNLIIKDLMTLPGYKQISSHITGIVTFEHNGEKIEIMHANKNTLENTLGADLIYYNLNFKSFTIVQYKLMKGNGATQIYRLDTQFHKQLGQMIDFKNLFDKQSHISNKSDYRINNTPFYFKFCPNIIQSLEGESLTHGMYVNIDYLTALINGGHFDGKRRGKLVTFDNVERWFDNTLFVSLLKKGWIGTNGTASDHMYRLVQQILENDRAVIIAYKA